jgi:hypothetical protein
MVNPRLLSRTAEKKEKPFHNGTGSSLGVLYLIRIFRHGTMGGNGCRSKLCHKRVSNDVARRYEKIKNEKNGPS